uniref:Putative secreted protein n=1 Tax=Ixodes ricinus TaxID=34613 RepID=A0A6B0UW41_IXORI
MFTLIMCLNNSGLVTIVAAAMPIAAFSNSPLKTRMICLLAVTISMCDVTSVKLQNSGFINSTCSRHSASRFVVSFCLVPDGVVLTLRRIHVLCAQEVSVLVGSGKVLFSVYGTHSTVQSFGRDVTRQRCSELSCYLSTQVHIKQRFSKQR